MTNERDPELQNLFDLAARDITAGDFAARVESRINEVRRKTIFVWTAVYLLLTAAVLLLTAPVLEATSLVLQFLPRSLVELDDGLMSQVLAPVNTVSAVVGLGILGMRAAIRKLF